MLQPVIDRIRTWAGLVSKRIYFYGEDMRITNLGCCGVREIANLSAHKSAPEALRAFCEGPAVQFDLNAQGIPPPGCTYRNMVRGTYKPPSCAFALFTQVEGHKYGTKFAALILREKLGEVYETQPRVNPNSGNSIRVWVWGINRDALEAWFLQDAAERKRRRGDC